jgi:hypothetical protein
MNCHAEVAEWQTRRIQKTPVTIIKPLENKGFFILRPEAVHYEKQQENTNSDGRRLS